MISLKSLSRKEEKYQMESSNLEPSTRLYVSGEHKIAFNFYPWPYFQVLNYFSAYAQTSKIA